MHLFKPGTTTLDADEYFHLALHASSAGEHHACMMYLAEVLQQQPRNARAIYLLAVQHAEIGLTERAINGMNEALSLEPDLQTARFQLGLLLLFNKHSPAEAKQCLAMLESSPDASLRVYSQALIAIADDDVERARERLTFGLSQPSSNPGMTALMQRVLGRLASGEPAEGKNGAQREQVHLGAYGRTRS